jgi:hypothetical protein
VTYQEWIKGTSAGMFSPRSSELKAIDQAFDKYEKAVTPYGKQWEAYETRIALEKWKKAKGPDWKKSERNRTGLVEQLDRELPPVNAIGNGYGPGPSDPAENLRKGALFFLSRCTTLKEPNDLAEFFNDGTDASSDVQGLVDTGGASGWRVHGSEFYDKDNKKNGFLESLSEKLIEYITELAVLAKVDEFAGDAARWVVKQLPELLVQIFAGILSKLTAVVEVGKGIAQAISAARGAWRTRLIEEGVMSGHPQIVVHSVREQIKDYGYDGLKSAAKAGFLAGVAAIPGAGTVLGVIANAIASVVSFVTKAFDHFRGIRRLNRLFATARTKLEAGLHRYPEQFHEWFLETIAKLPIVSCYCMTMPLTGSYYGFLTLVGTDGTEMSYKQLERNYAQFGDVKSWASKFVKGFSIQLRSADPIVAHSLGVARGKQEDFATVEKGLVARAAKVAIGVVETAVGDVAKRG